MHPCSGWGRVGGLGRHKITLRVGGLGRHKITLRVGGLGRHKKKQ